MSAPYPPGDFFSKVLWRPSTSAIPYLVLFFDQLCDLRKPSASKPISSTFLSAYESKEEQHIDALEVRIFRGPRAAFGPKSPVFLA